MPYEHRRHHRRVSYDEKSRLRAERSELKARMTSLKRDIRTLVAELGTLQRRLDDIDASGNLHGND